MAEQNTNKPESKLNGKEENKQPVKATTKSQPANAGEANGKNTSAKKTRVEKPKQEWNFPKNTLEDAIEIAKAIEDKNGGNPTDASDLAKMVGFNNPDWRFTDLLRSANFYGLVEGKGAKAKVMLTELGTDVVAPSAPSQRQKALLNSFRSVPLFKDVYDYYSGKKIPEDEYFSNTLAKNFGVARERITAFIEVFQKNLNFLKAFNADHTGEKMLEPSIAASTQDAVVDVKSFSPDRPSNIREFLDTCFILMPFGEWYDRYYEELYVPATKEAGFEPIRADGLFTTGSVMEQIWEQIHKAKVLVADLSGKNPNVFYELGLSHALGKPVILVTGNLEDVPFDLRHLRVIVYDIRVPNWGEILKKFITSYLKNAKAEPEKSIPQPYRQVKAAEK